MATQQTTPPRMPVIYVCGPYRATSEHALVSNIRRAESAAISLWRIGCAAICPHMNTALMGGVVPDDVFIDGDLNILERCDAVLTLRGWQGSVGSRAEVAYARHKGVLVFHEIEELQMWLPKWVDALPANGQGVAEGRPGEGWSTQ